MPTFQAMTWNVENFFKPGPSAAPDEQQRYQNKVALLAHVISTLDPDVVALQEIGGTEPVQDLQTALVGTFPHAVVSQFPDHKPGHPIRVAFLSKLAVDEQADMVNFPPGPALQIMGLSSTAQPVPVTRMSRGALRIRVTKDGRTVDLVTAHLKSKLLSFPRPDGSSSFAPRDEDERAQVAGLAILLRAAEAVTLRIAANALLAAPDRVPLLLLGDFNDEPEAQTSLILDGPPGSTIGTRPFEIPDQGDAARLFNVVLALPPGRNFTRMYHGVPELIDHIYASDEFFPIGPNHRRTLPQPGDVDSHVDFGETPSLPSIGDDPTARAAAIAPDHAPVTARLSL